MLIVGGNQSAGGYEVDNSLRFNSGSSDYLSRTPASTTDTKTWTWSGWVKLNKISGNEWLFGAYSSISLNTKIYLDNNNNLNVHTENSTVYRVQTDAVLRDFSAWYHIVVAFDTTQATESNRIKIYINGTQQSLTEEASGYPTQNWNGIVNNSSYEHNMGYEPEASSYFDGYMAEVCFIDGTALDPTSFGEFDANTGIWKPIDVSGLTFGTNGFYLDFENSGSLGADVSGNGNNFTVNNLTSIDQSTDTCTNNFATLNPLRSFEFTFSEGNLVATSDQPPDNRSMALSSFAPESGKWYAEIKVSTVGAMMIGLYATDGSQIDGTDRIYSSTGGIAYFSTNGQKYVDGSSSSYGASYTTNDIIGIALNMDDEEVTFYKNNVSQGAISLTSGKIYNMGISAAGTSACVGSFNFGNPSFTISSGNSDAKGYGNFEYAVPSGYYALNTKNLAEYG